ncbi:hypothetical protein SSYRP_v1c07460 [Spiroplasma syrphidicola EA-1]|uniref:Cytosolic endo-beta-N-acetylglucosaminidase TIM barrel domain-containing protein n=1 Tax=Spiroplasma syrphidicola EA-1 TaxID=1276229 RepID=R4UM76_9MOLU|nr:hypothetical protein [Spiroplasma syrphidicola]AGM26336.1 hypothetical protein SSYRP_v1c07460 [Spiroplasma syrphidicola EA-1]
MKKRLNLLASVIVVGAMTLAVVACDIGDKNGNRFLNSLPDFDWSDLDYGDGLKYDLNNNPAGINVDGNISQNGQSIKALNSGRFLDYSKFSTGFQYKEGIKKQAVTGAPMNKGFMPNGNFASDFGITSKAQSYKTVNSILDWSPNNDNDAKYNRSNVKLQTRVDVPFYNPEQHEGMNFNYLGFSTRKHRTFDSSIVGSKNPFENTNTNWQYINNFINWSGSWFEGPIVPPPADTIDIAHKNGVPIYGNVFLDGSHGLTKDMLTNFIKKDASGNYLIVDKLIEIAQYNGFDGWFLNDESNGFDPNGTVLDYHVILDIVNQFNQKINRSEDENVKKLRLTFYRAWSTLSKRGNDYVDKETYGITQEAIKTKTPIDIQLDFSEPVEKSEMFLKENPFYKNNNLYTMLNISEPGGGYTWSIGTYDWKQLSYKLVNGYNNSGKSIVDYDKNVWSSFSGYMDDGSGAIASYAAKKLTNYNSISDFVFATQVNNLYNDIIFNGLNTNINPNDKGLNLNRLSNDYRGFKDRTHYKNLFLLNDDRIKVQNKDKKLEDTDNEKFIKNFIYNANSNNGINSNSYGIGNLIKEKTVISDKDQDINFATNFSMGSGIQFVDRDSEGNSYVVKNYPFTNKRLADVLPTYQWNIDQADNSDLSSYDILNPKKPAYNKINGFYDYYDVFKKTNSLSIGSGFDEYGKVIPAKLEANKKYLWNIMGTDIKNKNNLVQMAIKNDSNLNTKGLVTITDIDGKSNRYEELEQINSQKYNDNWTIVTFDLSQIKGTIDNNHKISRIGLSFSANADINAKLNVGQLKIFKNSSSFASQDPVLISNLKIEYLIKRENSVNIRFLFESIGNNVDYYEFYIKSPKSGIWNRAGETTMNNYFIRDINVEGLEHINLAIIPIDKQGNIMKGVEFKIEI